MTAATVGGVCHILAIYEDGYSEEHMVKQDFTSFVLIRVIV
jgi:hypothetical protein